MHAMTFQINVLVYIFYCNQKYLQIIHKILLQSDSNKKNTSETGCVQPQYPEQNGKFLFI